ncbi:MAG: hypothetical protein NVSMB66_5000 [Candidatus Doudnabacteria bacterium]
MKKRYQKIMAIEDPPRQRRPLTEWVAALALQHLEPLSVGITWNEIHKKNYGYELVDAVRRNLDQLRNPESDVAFLLGMFSKIGELRVKHDYGYHQIGVPFRELKSDAHNIILNRAKEIYEKVQKGMASETESKQLGSYLMPIQYPGLSETFFDGLDPAELGLTQVEFVELVKRHTYTPTESG